MESLRLGRKIQVHLIDEFFNSNAVTSEHMVSFYREVIFKCIIILLVLW